MGRRRLLLTAVRRVLHLRGTVTQGTHAIFEHSAGAGMDVVIAAMTASSPPPRTNSA